MKKIYIDFEMNMANTKTKKDMLDADIIAIGAIKYDTDTGEIEKFKSLIKPITNLNIFPHIQELTNISQEDISKAPSYETVMRKFKMVRRTLSNRRNLYIWELRFNVL